VEFPPFTLTKGITMAKQKKDDVEVKKSLKKIRYLAKYNNFGFDYPAVNDDGTPKYKQNNQGGKILDGEGNAIPIHLHAKFTQLQTIMSKGYLSYYDYDPNDESAQNQAIGKTLEKLDIDQGVNVVTQAKYDREKNPDMVNERERREALEAELAEVKAKLDSPEELERRLSELTAPR
jgi:hypothetical protein